MGCADLLLAYGDTDDLDRLAGQFYEAIGIYDFEKRYSSNYDEGFYFVGQSNDLKVELCYTDDDAHSDRPFWAIIESSCLTDEEVVKLVDQWAAMRLAPLGFSLARVDGFGTKSEIRYNYSSDGSDFNG